MKRIPKPLPSIVPVSDIPKGEDVPTDNLIEVFRVCTQLERICHDKEGVGLSAVQVGIPWKLFVTLHKGRHFRYFLNCDYAGVGEKKKSIEGCLSLRTSDGSLRRFELDRFDTIKLTGQELVVTDKGLELKQLDDTVGGFEAIVCQHEIDHHRNVLISDIGVEIELF